MHQVAYAFSVGAHKTLFVKTSFFPRKRAPQGPGGRRHLGVPCASSHGYSAALCPEKRETLRSKHGLLSFYVQAGCEEVAEDCQTCLGPSSPLWLVFCLFPGPKLEAWGHEGERANFRP